MDTMTSEQRHRCMSMIRGRDTLPEIRVRRRLFAEGWRFRVCDRRFLGRPDIVISKAKTIIDVRGCFWHRHGCRASTMPKTNIAFWMEKWSKNVRRDRRNEKAWYDAGWNVIVVWECALAGAKAERTLMRVCSQVAAFADARKSVRGRPRRLELPKSPSR
ncbi:MAG: DNA mismatch endonuclease Vsr [Kiritimatiellae bacterium]|nr:DNA mismatch endonuclease Vsr [Kiritimatiellia bacterium]